MVFRGGGPLVWKAERQDRTSLSSCEAEIRATNLGSRLSVEMRKFSGAFASLGTHLSDCESPTLLYNKNSSCVTWSNSFTTKGVHHMENRENYVRENVQDNVLCILHVSGKVNPSDTFTKEMKDGAHLLHLRDSFFSSASEFASGAWADTFRYQAASLVG